MATVTEQQGQIADAFQAGRRMGFAVSALALGLVAFLSLLGMEKAILAIVLGSLAIRGAKPGALARRLGTVAVGLGGLFLVTIPVLLLVFWDRVVEFVRLLSTLS
jgi:hypothetical protein